MNPPLRLCTQVKGRFDPKTGTVSAPGIEPTPVRIIQSELKRFNWGMNGLSRGDCEIDGVRRTVSVYPSGKAVIYLPV